MIVTFTILAPLLLACVVLFIRFQPQAGNESAKNKFNIMVSALAVLGSITVSIYFWRTTGKSVDSAWWPVLAIFGSMFLISLILVVGAFIRYAVFKKDE